MSFAGNLLEQSMATKNSTKRPRKPPHETFFFEIEGWQPNYTFSANLDRDRDTEFREYAEIHLDAVCLEPVRVAGAKVGFILSGRRSYLDQPARGEEQLNPAVGLLELSPTRGSFYAGVPHESLAFLSIHLRERFRYILLSGPALFRGKSFIAHFHFTHSME